jgi:hypothetical protein
MIERDDDVPDKVPLPPDSTFLADSGNRGLASGDAWSLCEFWDADEQKMYVIDFFGAPMCRLTSEELLAFVHAVIREVT